MGTLLTVIGSTVGHAREWWLPNSDASLPASLPACLQRCCHKRKSLLVHGSSGRSDDVQQASTGKESHGMLKGRGTAYSHWD